MSSESSFLTNSSDFIVFRSSIEVNLKSTFIVSFTCLAIFAAVFSYLCWTETLWIKIFFRINHTLLVPREGGTSFHEVPSEDGTRNSLPPPRDRAGGDAPQVGSPPRAENGADRASWRALSLPARSALFSLPSLRDLIRVEEHPPRGCLPRAPLPTSFSQGEAGSLGGGHDDDPDVSRASEAIPGGENEEGRGAAFAPEAGFSRDYADPQAVLYVYTLKYFTAVMLFGGFFTIWILALAMNSGMTVEDRRKARGGGNSTADAQFQAIFKMTVQSIPAKSWMWWVVGLLNAGFAGVVTALTIGFVRAAGRYVDGVMARQLSRAPGYRLVCVRSARRSDVASVASFHERFLAERVYFSADSNSPRWHSWLEWLHPDFIWRLIRDRSSMLDRSDTILWESRKVRRVVITQRPPAGMLATMRRERRYVKKLQEAITARRARERKAAAAAEKNGGERGTENDARGSADDENATPVGVVVDDGETPPDGRRKARWLSCCPRELSVEDCEDRLRDAAVRLNQYIVEAPMQKADLTSFVEFEDSRAAFEFINLFRVCFGTFTSSALASIAGPHQDILLENLQIDKHSAILRRGLMTVLFIVLVTCYSIPIAAISSLENIALILGYHDEFVKYYEAHIPLWMSQIIMSYLPIAVLALFNLILPVIIRYIVRTMKLFRRHEFEQECLQLQTLFMVLSGVIFQSALQGGLEELASFVNTPSRDVARTFFIDCVVPKSNGYFYAKVLYALGLSIWVDAIDPVAFLKALFLRGYARTQSAYDALFARRLPDYVDWYSFDITTLTVGLLFHMSVPLLVPAVAVYFGVRYLLQRARLFDQHRTDLPAARDCTNFGLPAWVLRRTMLLYVLAEAGGLFVLVASAHLGGVVLVALTLTTACGLALYVGLATRDWAASLRRIHDLAVRGDVEAAREGAAPLQNDNDETGGGGGGQPHLQLSMGASVLEYEPTSPVMNAGVGKVCPECAMQLRGLARSSSCVARYRRSCLYLPLHLRLRIIDVEDEIAKMHAARYDVVRYWDEAGGPHPD